MGYSNKKPQLQSSSSAGVNALITEAITALKAGVAVDGDTLDKLNLKISALQTLLQSDNINLDTVQEIVDAIENVQASFDTILANDLTTNSATKALTAAQGVVIKGLIDALDSATAKREEANVFTLQNRFERTYGLWRTENFAPIQVISAFKPFAEIVLTADMVLSSVGTGVVGDADVIRRRFKQDGVGGHLVSFDEAVFEVGPEGWPTVPTTPNSYSSFILERQPTGKWLVLATVLGVVQ